MRQRGPGALGVQAGRLSFNGAVRQRAGGLVALAYDGRILFNLTPVYDLAFDTYAVGVALDPAGMAGNPEYGGVVRMMDGQVLALASITGQMAGAHTIRTEMQGVRLFMRNTATGVGENSVMRGAILNTSLAGSGHNRSLYARADAEPGATGFINAGVFAVKSVPELADAWAVMVSSEGVPGKNVGIYMNAVVPYGTGIVIGPSSYAHVQYRTEQGAIAAPGSSGEVVALTGAVNDSAAELLPADSLIRAVTVVPPAGVEVALGDAAAPERFAAFGLGARVGLKHHGTPGAVQATAGRLRVSVRGAASGQAKVTVFYERFIPE